jgi:23S rRNA pseudouridine1911/1915/1917 synthase
LPAELNGGWTYRDRVEPDQAGVTVSAYYASRHRHSDRATWLARLAAGEIEHNGQTLRTDAPLVTGDRLAWHRPPWQEGAVPAAWAVVLDDGDLLVIDKPSGLPVLPAGGWLEHTLLRLLERRHGDDPVGVPRPVHRLGRFTSGLLVCARRPATRAWWSKRLRESTTAGAEDGGESCRKIYAALTVPGALPLEPGDHLAVTAPVGQRPHPLLGQVWCAVPDGDATALAAHSVVTLLERHRDGDRVEVEIRTGRPHQIRIHLAHLGAPLLGDPLYLPGGGARADAVPGEGGYRLHAQKIVVEGQAGGQVALEAPLPPELAIHSAHGGHPAHHDLGGTALPGGLDFTPHQLSAFERRVVALVNALALPEVGLVSADERRRGIDTLPAKTYRSSGYYERWLLGVKAILIEKGLIDEAELERRIEAVLQRPPEH